MKSIIEHDMLGDRINTISGKAEYLCTELENKKGRFNDNYYTSDGYYLIHDGTKHYVYKVI